ncbi:unnamed protein product [Closterium sp. NIES-65]|nr:unnamed protein product [Closterium sp. NIES-65]
MASCAARHVAAVATSYSRDSSLRDSDAKDSLKAILHDAAFSAAVAVSSDATPQSPAAAKTAAEGAACEAPVVLVRAGTLATRRKLKCGSLRLDVSLQVDDHGGGAADDVVDVADLDGRCGIDGANDDHFSFETPWQATVVPAIVTTATSPTIAWSSHGRQFRKSSSASSAPLSVADGSANHANDAALQSYFAAAAAASLAAAAFPRAASAGAAYDKPSRSPLSSLTIAPPSPPLGAQQISPADAAARHADYPRGAISQKPQRRKRQNLLHKPAAEAHAAARQLAAPQAAAAQLAEFARGGLLSLVTPFADGRVPRVCDPALQPHSGSAKGGKLDGGHVVMKPPGTKSAARSIRQQKRRRVPLSTIAIVTTCAALFFVSVIFRRTVSRAAAGADNEINDSHDIRTSRGLVTDSGRQVQLTSPSTSLGFSSPDSLLRGTSSVAGTSGAADQSGDSGDGSAVVAGPRRVTGSGDEIAESGLDTDGGKGGGNDNFHNDDDNNEASNWAKLLEEKPRTAGSNSGHLTAAAAAAAADDDDSDADVAADDAEHESATPAKLPVRFLPLTHDMGDEELFWRASMVPLRRRTRPRGAGAGVGAEGEGGGAGGGGRRSIGPAKVALLFYSAGTMPFAPLWARWLEGHEDRVSVYVLTDETKIDKSLFPPIFRGRFVPNRSPGEPASADSKTVHMSTVDGMRRLLANALLDFSNERFVTICELCIPIHNFTFVYSYLISPHHSAALSSPSTLFQPKSLTSSGLHLAGMVPSAPRSYIPSNDVSGEGGRDRFNPNCFEPMLSVEQWRKGGAWIGLTRRLAVQVAVEEEGGVIGLTRGLAVQVISDSKFYDKFAACCVPVRGVFPACFPSEHYLPSIVPILLTPDLVSLMRHCHFGNLCHLFAGHFHPSAI